MNLLLAHIPQSPQLVALGEAARESVTKHKETT